VPVILRHQHRLHAPPVRRQLQQVSRRPIGRVKPLVYLQPPVGHPAPQLISQFLRQRRRLFQIRNVAAVQCIIYLAGSVRPRSFSQQFKQVGDIKSK
jgi:hypothetical protein